VKLLRLLMVLAYQVFYITILNYFLATANCNWLSKDHTLRFLKVDFPAEGERQQQQQDRQRQQQQ
jgi:hypothetical protein